MSQREKCARGITFRSQPPVDAPDIGRDEEIFEASTGGSGPVHLPNQDPPSRPDRKKERKTLSLLGEDLGGGWRK
jgi:hypothetical protein